MSSDTRSTSVLRVIVHEIEPRPGLTALCAGYEGERWRADELATELTDQLPSFALRHGELEGLSERNMAELMREAAKLVYETKKFERRGEFGELLLHVVLLQVFNTLPAISKIYYKDSVNVTVKGFDAVHVIATETSLELWLGEVKFYESIGAAIRDVVAELKGHSADTYLRKEFAAIRRRIDPSWPFADRLKKLIHRNTSLDEVFDAACIPVLLTYDSDTLGRHTKHSERCLSELEKELRQHHASFCGKDLPKEIRVHLFLIPLNKKKQLISALNRRLKTWQQI